MNGPNNPTELSDDVVADALVAAHGEQNGPDRQQWLDLMASDQDGPVIVLYQVAFKDRAADVAGADLGLTGVEAFMQAGAQIFPAVQDVGGVPVLGAYVKDVAGVPAEDRWDYFGAARYPSLAAVVTLWLDKRFVDAEPLREAGTERHRIWITEPAW